MKFTLPKNYLSPSQINMWLRCGQQYSFRYVDGKKCPPAVAMEEGSTYHATLELNNNHKIKQHEDLNVKRLFVKFADTFSDRKKNIKDWEEETPDTIIKRGKMLLPMYLKRFAPFYQPKTTERLFVLQLGTIPIHCVLDTTGRLHLPQMVNPKSSVVDYKTVGKRQSQATLDSDIQLSAYGMVAKSELQMENPEVGFCDLIKTKIPQVSYLSSPITSERLRWFKKIAFNVAEMISKGCFPLAKPDSWCCSNRFCGFWNECRGKTQRRKK